MNYSKQLIYILISLTTILIVYNLSISIEEFTGCTFLSQQKEVKTISKEEFERNTLKKLNSLESTLDELIYPLKFSKQNAKDLESIGPMQQSISDSQSGDVTGDTKLTGL